ncbi:MAG: GNAT family N-acetyltransferase [Bacteroidota bacterium]
MIRPFKQTDKEQLIEIFKLNTPTYFDRKELADFEDYLAEHSGTYLTIEHEGKIAGGTGYYIKDSDKSGRITWIFFHPECAGLGLGKQAVQHCLTILKSNPAIEKLVVTTSQLAYKFFEKFGYTLVQTEKDYWGQGLDLYLMEQAV